MIRHPGLPDARKWYEIPIGPQATIDLSVTAHVLITGTTGSGKTSVMRSIVLAAIDSAKRGEAEVILADPKRCELIGFRGWPGVRGVMTDDDSLWDMPIRLRKEMEERYRKSEEEGVQLGSFTPIIAVIDEYREFAARMRAIERSEPTASNGVGSDWPVMRRGFPVIGSFIAYMPRIRAANSRYSSITAMIGVNEPSCTPSSSLLR
jgi:energy-coupling factor transporter ATP-binding protein EcfA2